MFLEAATIHRHKLFERKSTRQITGLWSSAWVPLTTIRSFADPGIRHSIRAQVMTLRKATRHANKS